MSEFFAISVDRATESELNEVHQIIKENANGWWHRHVSFWVVGGLQCSEWRDLIKPFLVSGASVLVLELPADSKDRNWSFSGTTATEKCKWFHDNY